MRQLLALSLLLCAHAYAQPHCTRGSVNVDRDGKRLEVALSNECDALVSCKVSWRVQCGREAVQEKSEDVRIDARGEQRVTASASACGDGDWYIAPPKWRCEETTPIRDGDKPHRRERR
jgi:hypothetical protein